MHLSSGVATVSVRGGCLDAPEIAALRTVLRDLIDSPSCPPLISCPPVIVDLSELEWIDSAGLGVLIDTQRRLNAQQGRMILVGCSAVTRRAFEITRLVKVFELAETVQGARELLCAPSRLSLSLGRQRPFGRRR
jgi:anti-sigma B factor antagonist